MTFYQAMMDAKAEGFAEGFAEERMNLLISLVQKGLLPIETACQQVGMTEQEFAALLQKG